MEALCRCRFDTSKFEQDPVAQPNQAVYSGCDVLRVLECFRASHVVCSDPRNWRRRLFFIEEAERSLPRESRETVWRATLTLLICSHKGFLDGGMFIPLDSFCGYA